MSPDGIRNSGSGGKSKRRTHSRKPKRVTKVRRPKINWNQAQREAIDWDKKNVLINSSAGVGKTAIVVERITRLIKNGTNPKSIIATTFTKKAAEEMNDRLIANGIDTRRMSVQTMHSFCWRLLKKEKFQDWDIDDKDAYTMLIKKAVGYQGMNWRGCDITLVEEFISHAKNALVRPERSHEMEMFKGRPFNRDMRYCEAYFEIENLRVQRKLMTFDDMLIDGVELLQEEQRVRELVQDRYEYVIVDEYQDSNIAQIKLTDILAEPQWNLMVVGDVDQSIFTWRGAVPQYMLNFQQKYDAHVINMGINYRCAPNIVDCAAKCIVHNQERIPKEMTAHKTKDAVIRLIEAQDLDEEAELVADEVQQLSNDGTPFGSIYVLYRVNAQSRAIEEVFSKRKIPHVILGTSSFYQRKEIQDMLSYLRLIVNPKDYESGGRAINRPFRYISRTIVDEISAHCQEKNIDFVDAAEEIGQQGNSRVEHQIYAFSTLVRDMKRKYDVQNDPMINPSHEDSWKVGTFISEVINKTGYLNYLTQNEGSDTMENSRGANLGELIRSADRYRDIEEFLEFVEWQIKERKKSKDVVTCMTCHRGKGLQASAVFLIGVNEGILPHAAAETPQQQEEERRLFYVGITRAMDYLQVSNIRNLGMSNRSLEMSRFIGEAGLEEYRIQNDLTPAETSDTVKNSAGGQHGNSKGIQ